MTLQTSLSHNDSSKDPLEHGEDIHSYGVHHDEGVSQELCGGDAKGHGSLDDGHSRVPQASISKSIHDQLATTDSELLSGSSHLTSSAARIEPQTDNIPALHTDIPCSTSADAAASNSGKDILQRDDLLEVGTEVLAPGGDSQESAPPNNKACFNEQEPSAIPSVLEAGGGQNDEKVMHVEFAGDGKGEVVGKSNEEHHPELPVGDLPPIGTSASEVGGESAEECPPDFPVSDPPPIGAVAGEVGGESDKELLPELPDSDPPPSGASACEVGKESLPVSDPSTGASAGESSPDLYSGGTTGDPISSPPHCDSNDFLLHTSPVADHLIVTENVSEAHESMADQSSSSSVNFEEGEGTSEVLKLLEDD